LLFREMSDQKRTQAIIIITLALVIILGLVSESNAWEVQLGSNAWEVQLGIMSMTTFSDNIERASSGLETDGYLLTTGGEIDISGDLGAGTVDLKMTGGLETFKGDEKSEAENYGVLLNTRFPWTTTGYIEGSASFSEKTESPEVTDINQARERTRLSSVGLEAVRRVTSTFQWNAGVIAVTERRLNRKLEESRGDMGGVFVLKQSRSLSVDVGVNQGTEDIEGDSWVGISMTLDLTKQTDRLTSFGYRIDWEDTQVEKKDGTRELTDMLSAVTHITVERSSGWSVTGELGMDGIKPITDQRLWEPRAEVSLKSGPGRRIQFNGLASTSSSIETPNEDNIAWTRNSQVRTSIQWDVSRTYVVEPRIQYGFAELFGNGITDRSDSTLIFSVETRWSLSKSWKLNIAVANETIDSSEPSRNLAENKLDLTLSGTFF
jgi:hypothetical protein